MEPMRIGIDLGGTKIEMIALGEDGAYCCASGCRRRGRATTPRSAPWPRWWPRGGEIGRRGSVGFAIPGTISPGTGLVKNANSTRLIGHPLDGTLGGAGPASPRRQRRELLCAFRSE